MTDAARITALLGPTNTGKTHRAIERMLEHGSGSIGLPLRLLAREVYDRISARAGENAVALVTGEEKRVPKRPRYWVATVEAMPRDLETELVAVDEVQLAAHPQRGHVFTDRILNARGTHETLLLGSDTIAPVLRDLVPTARIESHPRLSRLSFTGPSSLARVPPRSAIVAFSMPEVYVIAERLRATKGGAAVVLGALSPRARNAQVAMFQAGEVDYLVATDAIGMGLNLDVTHVAFAGARKFDGRAVRDLDDAELAQIAGRAGRYVSDGTFGTLAPFQMPRETASAIESHRFAPLGGALFRPSELDFSSVDALSASLRGAPPRRSLRLVRDADDEQALAQLAKRPVVRLLARGEPAVRLLWEVAQIPDYRKLLFESHVALLEDVFVKLRTAKSGVLPRDWVEAEIAELDRADGDVDTLVARMAAVRTWTYVSQKRGWLDDDAALHERARRIEDDLSDALHARLVERFVDGSARRRGTSARPRPASRRGPRTDLPPDVDRAHPFAPLLSMRDRLSDAAREVVEAPARELVDRVVGAPHAELRLDAVGRISIDGVLVGRLVGGPSVSQPDVRVAGLDAFGAGARLEVHRRLSAFARDVVAALVPTVDGARAKERTAAFRGLAHRLERGLGAATLDAEAGPLDPLEARALAAAGFRLGARHAWAPRALRRESMLTRALLVALFAGRHPGALELPAGRVSFRRRGDLDDASHLALGYAVVHGRAVRVDVLERALAARDADPRLLASWLGCSPREARTIVGAPVDRPADDADDDGPEPVASRAEPAQPGSAS